MDMDRVQRGTAGLAIVRTSLVRAVTGCAAQIALGLATAPFIPFAGAQTSKVSIGITDAATDAGFFIADKKGYFRAEGIEVTTTPFASAAGMIAPLGRGQLDVGGGTVAAGLYNAVELASICASLRTKVP
jgi:ABC-type nitrate/sulfonate/bicarbonate transport system substrate-binding protein